MYTITANAVDKAIGIHYFLHEHEILCHEHVHDGFVEIMVLLRGELTHICEGSKRRLKQGDLVFLPNDSVHKIDSPTEDFLVLNLCALPSTFAQAIQYLRIPQMPEKTTYAHVEPPVTAYLLFHHAQILLKPDSAEKTMLIRGAFITLLPYCCEVKSPADWFETLLGQMEKQENFQAGVKRMQELAFCSPAHLCRTCRLRLNMTPTQYVDLVRIRYACDMLRHAAYSIQDICAECGYNNLAYFYRRFTQEMGMPPGKYQQKHYLEIKPRLE